MTTAGCSGYLIRRKLRGYLDQKLCLSLGTYLCLTFHPSVSINLVSFVLYQLHVSINIKYGKYSRNFISIIRDTCISIFSPLIEKATINGSLNPSFPTFISVYLPRFAASHFYSPIIGNYKASFQVLIRIMLFNKDLLLHQQLKH
jgi:hypothetical protein